MTLRVGNRRGRAPSSRSGIETDRHYSRGVPVFVQRRHLRVIAILAAALLVLAGCASSGQVVDVAAESNSADGEVDNTAQADTTALGANTAQPNEAADPGDIASADSAAPSSVAPAETASTTSTSSSTPTSSTELTRPPSTPSTTTIAEVTTQQEPTELTCIADVPLDVQIGQLLFPVMTQDEFGRAATLGSEGHLGGVVVLGSPDAGIGADIAAMQNQSALGPMIVAVDEEGGRVQRVEGLVGTQPSARQVAQNDDLETARRRAADHAVALGELGFTMNLAPVVDLDTGIFIGDRSYGSDPDVVSQYALSVADGILDGGLTPVLKHFPGHGAGTDSHTGLPTIPSLQVLEGQDLVPFERAIARGDLPIMIGHLVVPGLTDGRPATLSSAAVDGLLRGDLGFDGLVMTDALNMDAIAATTTNAEAAELALAAGVDLIMLGSLNAVEGTISHVTEAVESGRIPEEQISSSFLRVMEERGLEVCTLPTDFQPAIGCETGAEACR